MSGNTLLRGRKSVCCNIWEGQEKSDERTVLDCRSGLPSLFRTEIQKGIIPETAM